MSAVSRREGAWTVAMEPMMDGSFVDKQYQQYRWRCEGCGLVWEKKWHAEQCASRSHASSFEQGPYGVTYVLNGVPQGNPTYYTRRAVRRDRIDVPERR